MIFLIYKKCKSEEVVDTALEMEKDQNVEEAEVRIPKGYNLLWNIISEYDWRDNTSVDRHAKKKA